MKVCLCWEAGRIMQMGNLHMDAERATGCQNAKSACGLFGSAFEQDSCMSRQFLERVQRKVRRLLAEHINRRMVPIKPRVPIISFTFDDAPTSAFRLGRKILGDHGARATY